MTFYKLLMHIFQSKVTNQILVLENHENTIKYYKISHTKTPRYAIVFNEDAKVTQYVISWRLKCYWRFMKIKIIPYTSQILSKWYQDGVKGIKLLDDNFFCWHRTKPDLNRTIYDGTKPWSCNIPYNHNILHPVSSYDFQRYKKPF